MLRFCRNIAGAMRSSVKHTPTILPSRVEECQLSLNQTLNGKRHVSICVKSVDLPRRKVAYIDYNIQIYNVFASIQINYFLKLSKILLNQRYFFLFFSSFNSFKENKKLRMIKRHGNILRQVHA